ncbi:DUF2790 domain-containing protein [uncultured Pseudomonas sp.]|uniref:DUF2790 domain-containing protein n=1 Tax=uncultured Pseudomonas sp. TaxID=114707 RepID=UPI0025E3EB2F|nr:DUF2790 domain-containing protein [uncultured Pseudomonas sp.]
MKRSLWVLALCGFSTLVMADEPAARTASQTDSAIPAVETYTYGSHPDIARVISISPTPNVCKVVPVRMTYEDSHGQRHVMSYQIMANGCGNS